jgi:hypothetical protein
MPQYALLPVPDPNLQPHMQHPQRSLSLSLSLLLGCVCNMNMNMFAHNGAKC